MVEKYLINVRTESDKWTVEEGRNYSIEWIKPRTFANFIELTVLPNTTGATRITHLYH